MEDPNNINYVYAIHHVLDLSFSFLGEGNFVPIVLLCNGFETTFLTTVSDEKIKTEEYTTSSISVISSI
jgi:hypothetical protein